MARNESIFLGQEFCMMNSGIILIGSVLSIVSFVWAQFGAETIGLQTNLYISLVEFLNQLMYLHQDLALHQDHNLYQDLERSEYITNILCLPHQLQNAGAEGKEAVLDWLSTDKGCSEGAATAYFEIIFQNAFTTVHCP